MSIESAMDGLDLLFRKITQIKLIPVENDMIKIAVDFTVKHFKDLTLKEIDLAFEYESAGKLKLPENHGHYGVFSLEYIGVVLKAFRDYRIQEAEKEQKKGLSLDEQQTSIISQEELEELNRVAMEKGIAEVWEMFKAGNVEQYEPLIQGMGHLYYDHLRNKGVIEKPSKELQKEIIAEAEKQMKEKLRQQKQQYKPGEVKFKDLAKELNNVSGSPNFKNTCKKIAVKKFFQEKYKTKFIK